MPRNADQPPVPPAYLERHLPPRSHLGVEAQRRLALLPAVERDPGGEGALDGRRLRRSLGRRGRRRRRRGVRVVFGVRVLFYLGRRGHWGRHGHGRAAAVFYRHDDVLDGAVALCVWGEFVGREWVRGRGEERGRTRGGWVLAFERRQSGGSLYLSLSLSPPVGTCMNRSISQMETSSPPRTLTTYFEELTQRGRRGHGREVRDVEGGVRGDVEVEHLVFERAGAAPPLAGRALGHVCAAADD